MGFIDIIKKDLLMFGKKIFTVIFLSISVFNFFACGDDKEIAEKIPTVTANSSSSSIAIFHSSSSSIPYTPQPSTNQDTWVPGTGWSLAWADEFNIGGISASNWSHQVLPAGTFNNEWQRYTDSIENSYVFNNGTNGYLLIRAVYEGGGLFSDNFTSARLITVNKQDFLYGKIAARIQLPYGQGLWPAFWMLGTNINETGGDTPWPACGEIDIMEMIGGGAGRDDTSWGAIHWDNSGHVYSSTSRTLPSGILADDFHVFEIEWDSTNIVWKVDGNTFFTKDITPSHMSEFHKRFYIILNVAVGGIWPEYPNTSTVFPQYMYVDWVRVYTNQ